MTNIPGLVADCARELLTSSGRVTVAEVVERVYAVHETEIAEAGEQLIALQVRRIATRELRGLSDDEEARGEQQVIPGLALPSAIAIRKNEDEIYYVYAARALWWEVLAGKAEREQNIARAIAKDRLYGEAMDRLRPWMEKDPTCTVADALRKEAAARALVSGSGSAPEGATA